MQKFDDLRIFAPGEFSGQSRRTLTGGAGTSFPPGSFRNWSGPAPADAIPARHSAEGSMVVTACPEASTEERFCRIDVLDLEPIAYKLVHPEPGEITLSVAEADQAVALYRRFLKLCVLHPGARIVPTRQIDRVWHAHVLDTAKYRADCDHLFGHFMDHFPYAGLRGEADRRAWRADFAQTRGLFAEHFGEEIGSQPAPSACGNHGGGADCWVGCIKTPTADVRPRPERDPAAGQFRTS
jgi:hypothetical protein